MVAVILPSPSGGHRDWRYLICGLCEPIAWYYFGAGARYNELAARWAAEIVDLIHTHGAGNRRLAIDRCHPEGVAALGALGVELHNGEEVMELARAIKSEDEIRAVRCAMAACESSMRVMREHLVSGVSEQRLWSYLHAENIARIGEWIEIKGLRAPPFAGFTIGRGVRYLLAF